MIEQNEGTRFAVALPYCSREYESELIFNAKTPAIVTVELPSITQIVHVPRNGAARYMLNNRMRVDDDIESRGILVTSDNPITVHVGTDFQPRQEAPEATVVKPITDTSTYFPLATFKGSQSGQRPNNFYMVVANQSDTNVVVYFKEGDDFVVHRNVTLNLFDVLTYDVEYDELATRDFTGGYVVADQPVSVYSGTGVAYAFTVSRPKLRLLYNYF